MIKPRASKLKATRIGRKTGSTAYKAGQTTRIRRNNAYTDNWFEISAAVKRRDGYCCRKCGSDEDLEVHHIIPVSKGGTNSQANLITLCHRCHKRQPRHGHLK